MDLLELLLRLLHLIFLWRITVSVIAGGCLAAALGGTFPWISGFQMVFITFLGCFFGMMWEAKSELPKNENVAPEEMEKPRNIFVAMLGATSVGFGVGFVSSETLQAFWAGSVMLSLAILGGWWYASYLKSWATKDCALSAVLAVLFYPLGAWVGYDIW